MPHQMLPSACAEVDTGNADAEWVRTESELFRSEGIKTVGGGGCARQIEHSSHGKRQSAQWQLALDFTARSENLRSSCHAVERIPSAGRGRAAQFVPIRFLFSKKLTRHCLFLNGTRVRINLSLRALWLSL